MKIFLFCFLIFSFKILCKASMLVGNRNREDPMAFKVKRINRSNYEINQNQKEKLELENILEKQY